MQLYWCSTGNHQTMADFLTKKKYRALIKKSTLLLNYVVIAYISFYDISFTTSWHNINLIDINLHTNYMVLSGKKEIELREIH